MTGRCVNTHYPSLHPSSSVYQHFFVVRVTGGERQKSTLYRPLIHPGRPHTWGNIATVLNTFRLFLLVFLAKVSYKKKGKASCYISSILQGGHYILKINIPHLKTLADECKAYSSSLYQLSPSVFLRVAPTSVYTSSNNSQEKSKRSASDRSVEWFHF